MFWRAFSLLAAQFAGGLVGSLAMSRAHATGRELEGVVVGIALGALVWFLIDSARATRLLDWLRRGDTSGVALTHGLWGELADRTRRLLRARELAAQDSQDRLHDFLAALQASPNGVMLLEAQGRIEWFNQTAALHFGLDSQRDRLQHVGNLVRDPGFAAYFSDKDYLHELEMPGRENTPLHPVKLSVHLHPYGEGRLLMLSRDVTAVQQAEAQRRDFIANVSHEIRTPLTVLAGFVETLQSLDLSAQERKRYLALMAQQAARMQTLVGDLLTLSKLEGSPAPGLTDWWCISDLMRELEDEAASLSAVLNPGSQRLHQLHFECAPPWETAGASNEIRSAMSNLLSNAIRYTSVDGEIVVRASLLANGTAQFSVSDTGCGIAPEHIARLTQRFYRVDHSRSRDTGGTGLGLAIVKHVAQRHGIELKIGSALGRGSVFTLTFPANRVRPMGRLTAPEHLSE